MNFFQNISIKSRFNFILISVLILILIIITFFIFSVNKINQYNEYYRKADKLKIQYLNLRRYELQFLLRYNDDIDFFISERNKYIDKFERTSDAFSNINQVLTTDFITKKSNLNTRLISIENIHDNYEETFSDLTHKIFIRGNITSGIIGDLKTSEQEIINSNMSPQTKSIISEMVLLTDNYLLSEDATNYTEFIKRYNKISKSETVNINDTSINNPTVNLSGFDKTLQNYKTNFTALIKIDKLIGLKYDEGFLGKLRTYSQNLDPEIEQLLNEITEFKQTAQKQAIYTIIIFFILIGVVFLILFKRFSSSVANPLNELKDYIKPVSLGIFPSEKLNIEGNNELAEICNYTNKLITGLEKTSDFANNIGKGNYNIDYTPLSKQDALGNALLEMKDNIVISSQEEEKRKHEDEIRTWTNEGLTKFNDILRLTQGNISEMSAKVISELVKFINANQGGMFVFNDDEDEKFLELTAAYAYGHEKKKEKIIYPGEGMVGMVAAEKKTVYMTEIPETYITITSGLGDAVPGSLLIVPMITEDEIIGVIELASFNKLEKHEIRFVEILSETIASSLSITKINQKTSVLLKQSQKQAELMKIQEEEMRQNFEELQQAQENSAQKTAQMSGILAAIDTSSLVLEIDLDGTIISANRNLLDLIEIEEQSILNINIKDFIHSETEQEFNEFWQKLINGQNIQRTEYIKHENREFWLSTVYAPILDENAKISYILSIASDLSESKKLEFELTEREKQLRLNLEEINKSHKEAERKQHILENTNEMLKANEKTLQSAVESAMKQRKELAKKMDEIAEREAETNSWFEGINQTNITAEFDLNGNILSVNHIFEKVFDYTEKELKTKNHNILVTEQELNSEEYKKRWEKLHMGIHVSGTFQYINKNKERIYIQGTYTAIKDHKGKTLKIYLIGSNTSDLIKRSEELKARETELYFQIEDMKMLQKQKEKQEEELSKRSVEIIEQESLTKSRTEGINRTILVAEFDMDGNILFANNIFTKTFDYSEKELISKHHEILITKDFAQSKEYKNAWEQLNKGEYLTETFTFISKNKSKIFIQGTYTPVKNSKGEIIKILLTGFDTTDLIKRTEELKARETELSFQLEELKLLEKKSKNGK
ncbi:MAG: PAS domain S-box protein [Bacteroidales bacterium]|nr:PAS domain S-box protein [Bacteroidales bacterium]